MISLNEKKIVNIPHNWWLLIALIDYWIQQEVDTNQFMPVYQVLNIFWRRLFIWMGFNFRCESISNGAISMWLCLL